MSEKTEEIGAFTIILRTFAGIIGGSIGAVIFFTGVVLLSSADTSILTSGGGEKITPFFVVATLIFTFLSATISSMLVALFTSIVNKKRYTKMSSVIFQIFFYNIVVFLLIVPVYFIEFIYSKSIPILAISIHMLVSTQSSALILEIRGNTRQSLITVYSSTLSLVLSTIIIMVIQNMLGSYTAILFIILPLIAGLNGFIYALVSIISTSLSNTYDKDFLSITEDFGKDYGVQDKVIEEKIEEKTPTSIKDGADFLREKRGSSSN